jgi:hypothetical protein
VRDDEVRVLRLEDVRSRINMSLTRLSSKPLNSRRTYDDIFTIHREFWNNRMFIENKRECTLEERTRLIEDGRKGISDLPLADGTSVTDGMLITPSMLSPAKIHSAKLNVTTGRPQICGKIFQVLFPYPKIPWTSGILGSQLKASTPAESIWPLRVFDREWYRKEPLEIHVNEEWFEKLLEFTRYLIDHFHPDYLVTQDVPSRGPGDLLALMMGAENMYAGMYAHPKEIKRLVNRVAEIFIKVASAQFDLIPKFQDGYCNQFGLWSHGTSIWIQEDLATNLSPQLIREFLLPADEKILRKFHYSVFHTHSGCIRLSEMVSDLDCLRAVEVVTDPHGPPVMNLLPILGRIQKKKPLVFRDTVDRPFTLEERSKLRSELASGGCLLD